jgi:2-aminoadipate transaminase
MSDYQRFLSKSAGWMRASAIRQAGAVLATRADIVSFAPGYPAEDVLPWEEFAEIAREVLTRADAAALQYGPTRGFAPLRETIAQLLSERGVDAAPAGLMITTGSQQGLDLVARTLLDPGDVVLIELPSYTGAIMAFRNVGAMMIGVKQEAGGIDLADLQRQLRAARADGRRVKLLYVVPNFQNPTGGLLDAPRRQDLLEWARREDVLILEDDPYRDLYFEDSAREEDTRPIAADDRGDARVVYLSSFSKTLAPGFRVGWIAAPAPIAAKLELAKQASDLCSGGLDQMIVYEACRRGVLARQLPRLRRHYCGRRDALADALTSTLAGRISWPAPRGGFFLWARLTPPLTSRALLTCAQARGVIFVPGPAFFVDSAGDEYMRLSFSAAPLDRIGVGVSRLAEAIADAEK